MSSMRACPLVWGRIVGDGALNFEIVDVAVDPAHQGKGLGRQIMQKIVSWLDENAVKGAYVAGGGCSLNCT